MPRPRVTSGFVTTCVLSIMACAAGDGGAPGAAPTSAPGGASAGTAYFPPAAIWYQDVSTAALDRQSAAVIGYLDRVGWGLGRMQVDFSIEVLTADAATPLRPFVPTQDHFSPDCDVDPVPVPPGGALEGEDGYECLRSGDCHLIVVDRSRMKLFEMWRADIRGDSFRGGCLAVWDMTRVYPQSGRGEQCTSADAAGYPIAPLLFDADEVAAGRIDHAIRFILPNATIRAREYVHPATHGTRATSGPPDAPPYGTRLRLRADYPLASLPNESARTVARAMQRYGMLLSDAGRVALTARSDRTTRAKWAGLLGPLDLQAIRPRDFEMIEAGERIPLTNDCVRNP
jgi:serine/threonine-protein kinase